MPRSTHDVLDMEVLSSVLNGDAVVSGLDCAVCDVNTSAAGDVDAIGVRASPWGCD